MTVRRMFVMLFALDLFCIAVRTTLDPDMWWHLRTGALIWQSGIPRQDPFSFSMRGHDWIAHEWLSDAVMWVVYQVGGLAGLALAFAALTAVAFWLVYQSCAGQPYVAAAVVLLGAFAAAPKFGVRPQTFTMLFAAVFVCLVEAVKAGRLRRHTLWLLPSMTVVWANLHGGYLLGVVLLSAYAAGEAVDLLVRRAEKAVGDQTPLAWADVRLMTALAVACLAAALLNPHGWRLWSYPFGTLGSDAMQEYIAEWRSPDFHRWVYWPFALLMGIGIAALARGTTRPRWGDVLLFLGTATAALVSTRHIPLFAIVAAPIVSRALMHGRAWPRVQDWNARPEVRSGTARLNWTIVIVGILIATVWVQRRLTGNNAAIAATYPVAAVDFLQRRGLNEARGFNAYEWGGYLIWRGVPVFVDGRADVYGDGFLSRYLQTSTLSEDWRQPLDAFDIGYVMIQRTHPLALLLGASGQWHEAYSDEVARIFVRGPHSEKRNGET